ncbi:MAG: nuclear transport factor 2 family protein [Propionibacteriaceae bacterium]
MFTAHVTAQAEVATAYPTSDCFRTPNAAAAVTFLDHVSAHDVEALMPMVTTGWTMVGGPPGLLSGEEGIRQLFAHFGRIRQSWQIDFVIEQGHYVVVRGTCTGEQDAFMGIPAQGKQQVFTATFIHQFVDGLIHRTYRNADDLGRLRQLGAVISAAPAT